MDVVTTRETLSFVQEHAGREPDTPWFVCAGYCRPHPPYTAPGRYLRRYQGKVPPLHYPPDLRERLEPFARRHHDRSLGTITPEQNQYAREAYYACVDFVDDCIGELLEGLKKAGLLDNTIVIYSSDHGEMAGAQGIWGRWSTSSPQWRCRC